MKEARLPLHAPIEGRLLRRYKRFLVDVATPAGEILRVHCPNPGSMRGTDRPGSRVRCSTSDSPGRKLRHTLEMIRVGRIWVGLHTQRANELVASALAGQAIPALRGYGRLAREVSADEHSRLDFQLNGHARDARPAWVEVKSVTWAQGNRARFPDAVTERGRRHMQTLMRLRREGSRAVLLFVVQRGDCEAVEPAEDVDPAYAAALRAAARAGVEVLAVRARVRATELRLERELPVLL